MILPASLCKCLGRAIVILPCARNWSWGNCASAGFPDVRPRTSGTLLDCATLSPLLLQKPIKFNWNSITFLMILMINLRYLVYLEILWVDHWLGELSVVSPEIRENLSAVTLNFERYLSALANYLVASLFPVEFIN